MAAVMPIGSVRHRFHFRLGGSRASPLMIGAGGAVRKFYRNGANEISRVAFRRRFRRTYLRESWERGADAAHVRGVNDMLTNIAIRNFKRF